MHWSQAGCVPSHGRTLTITEGVHREMTPGIQYRFLHIQAGFEPTPTVIESGACTAMGIVPLGHGARATFRTQVR